MALKYFCDKCGKELVTQDRYNLSITIFPNIKDRQDLRLSEKRMLLCKKDAEYVFNFFKII